MRDYLLPSARRPHYCMKWRHRAAQTVPEAFRFNKIRPFLAGDRNSGGATTVEKSRELARGSKALGGMTWFVFADLSP